MRRGRRAATLILVAGVALVTAIVASTPGCKDCAAVPCPTPGWDPDTCSCRPKVDLGAVDGGGDAGDAGDASAQ